MPSTKLRSARRISAVATLPRCAKRVPTPEGESTMDDEKQTVFHSSALKSASDNALKDPIIRGFSNKWHPLHHEEPAKGLGKSAPQGKVAKAKEGAT